MATYVNDKTKAFKTLGDPTDLPTRQRSEARMKAYHSATDARAWSNVEQENKEYIIDLVNAEFPKQLQLGKYVPIEALIDTLMANKNADIKKLNEQIKKLERIMDQLDLTSEQRKKLERLKAELAGGDARKVDKEPERKTKAAGLQAQVQQRDDEAQREQATRVGASRSKQKAAPLVQYDAADDDDDNKDMQNKLKCLTSECNQHKELARKAIEQLESLKGIIEERDDLRKKLTESEEELRKLKGRVKQETCESEIKKMEDDLDKLRQSGKSDELDLMSRELQVLKKYCEKLNSIKQENKKLKAENDDLKNKLRGDAGIYPSKSEEADRLAKLKKHHSEVVSIDSQLNKSRDSNFEDDNEESDMKGYYKDQVAVLKQKVDKLNEITKERDKLQESVTKLETELQKYGSLNDEVEVFRERSKILDTVLEERDSLHKRLDRMKGLEDELIALKKKAARADECERLLAEARKNVGISESKTRTSKQDLDRYKSESSQELEKLRYRAKEAEVLRIERDRLKLRLDELAAMEEEFKEIQDKLRCLEQIQNERDHYKSRCEELEGLQAEYECLKTQVEAAKALEEERATLVRRVRDLECVIADQENEINRLVSHVDRLSRGQEKQQDLMKKVLGDLRDEIEQKNSLIAVSEEKLAGVQDQLKKTITEVTSDTSNLMQKIDDSEKKVADLDKQLKSKLDELAALRKQLEDRERALARESTSAKELQDKENLIEKLQRQIEELQKHNARLQEIADKMNDLTDNQKMAVMLQKSKMAVRKATAELSSKYKTGETEETCARKRAMAEHEKSTQKDDRDECKEWKDKVQQLEKELKDLKAMQGAAERMSAENQALRRHSNEIQEVAKDQIQDLALELRQAKDLIAKLQAENDELRRQLGDNKKETTDACDEWKKQVEDLKKRLEASAKNSGDCDALSKENDDLRKQIENLMKQIDDLKNASKDTSRLDQLNKENDDLKKQLEALKKQLEEASKPKDEPVKTDQNTQFSKENDELKKQIEDLKKQLEECKKDKGKIDSLSKENDDLRKELENLRKQLGGEKADISTQKEPDEKIKKELEDVKKENADLKKQIDDLKKQLEDCKKKLDEKPGAPPKTDDADLEKERREKKALEDMIKNLENQLNTMDKGEKQDKGKDDDDRLKDCLKQLEEQKAKAKAAEEALAKGDTGGTVKKLQDDLNAKDEEIKKLKQRIKELEDELNKLKSAPPPAAAAPRPSAPAAAQAAPPTQIAATSPAPETVATETAAAPPPPPPPPPPSDGYKEEVQKLEKELENQKRESMDAIKGLKSQYDRDIKNLQGKYNNGIQKLQASHEEIVSLGNRELERENEELRKQSLDSKLKIDLLQAALECKDVKKPSLSKSVQKMDIQPQVEVEDDKFRALLKKILKCGIESLTFEELQYMHTKVCDATAKVIGAVPRQSLVESFRNMPPCTDIDLKRRQKIAQGQVAKLQLEVAIERQRLEDLKRTLEVEKQTNCELAQRIRTQSKTVNNYINALEQEQSKTKFLEQNLQKEKHMTKQLSNMLGGPEKRRCTCWQKEGHRKSDKVCMYQAMK